MADILLIAIPFGIFVSLFFDIRYFDHHYCYVEEEGMGVCAALIMLGVLIRKWRIEFSKKDAASTRL